MKVDNAVFFRLAGMGAEESEFLAAVVSNPNLTLDALTNTLRIDPVAVASLISRLVERDIVVVTAENKVRIEPHFAVKVASLLESSADEFAEKLRSGRFLVMGRFAEELEGLFQAAGYAIKKDHAEKPGVQSHVFPVSYAFMAEKFYRFGVLVIGEATLETLESDEYPPYYRWRMLPELEETAHCLGSFVLLDPELGEGALTRVKKGIAESLRRYPSRRRERFMFIPDPDRPIKDFILENLAKIDSRREIVEQEFAVIRNRVKAVRDLVVEDSMLVSRLNSVVTGKYMPLNRKAARAMGFMSTVKSVIDREARNLEIFEAKFGDEKSDIEKTIDNFDKRLVLPDPAALKERQRGLALLESKFSPIREELTALDDLLLTPLMTGGQPMRLNPFILTEPNDVEIFTVNQASLKETADKFYSRFLAGGSNLLLLTGAAGTGKTHAMKHMFRRRAEELGIWPVYIDCPRGYDLISSLSAEVAQDRNFPAEMKDLLPSLRKERPTTAFEFIGLLRKLRDMVLATGCKALVLVVDELENSLPYTYDFKYTGLKNEGEEPALALTQLRAILTSELSKDIGFVLAFRDHILDEVRGGLHLKDFDSFVVHPETLSAKHFVELAELRQKTWKSRRIAFPLPIVRKVIAKSESNTRHTIQYFRALYRRSAELGLSRVTSRVLDDIGDLALFTY